MRILKISNLLAVFTALFATLIITGCSDSSYSNDSENEMCVEPENQYNEDTGHYAGYQWAEENGESCDGNSDEFNEGCEEYYTQVDEYESCITRGKQ